VIVDSILEGSEIDPRVLADVAAVPGGKLSDIRRKTVGTLKSHWTALKRAVNIQNSQRQLGSRRQRAQFHRTQVVQPPGMEFPCDSRTAAPQPALAGPMGSSPAVPAVPAQAAPMVGVSGFQYRAPTVEQRRVDVVSTTRQRSVAVCDDCGHVKTGGVCFEDCFCNGRLSNHNPKLPRTHPQFCPVTNEEDRVPDATRRARRQQRNRAKKARAKAKEKAKAKQ
jgi:hypothetical protein